MAWNKRGIDRRKTGAETVFQIKLANGEIIIEERRNTGRRSCNYIADQKIFLETPYYLIEPVLLECPIKKLQTGELLIAKGEENFFLYLLISGSLHISFSLTDVRESFIIQPGECVGEVSLLDGNLTSAFVIAAEPSEVVVIHENIFWEQLAIYPNILKKEVKWVL